MGLFRVAAVLTAVGVVADKTPRSKPRTFADKFADRSLSTILYCIKIVAVLALCALMAGLIWFVGAVAHA